MGGGINQRFRISMFLKGGPVAMSAYKATSLYIERLDDLCCHKAWKAGHVRITGTAVVVAFRSKR